MSSIEVFRAPGFAVDVDPTSVTIKFAVPATNIGGSQIRLRRDGELAEFLAHLSDPGPVLWKETIAIGCDEKTYHFAYAGDAYTFTVIVENDLVMALMQNLQHLLAKKGDQA